MHTDRIGDSEHFGSEIAIKVRGLLTQQHELVAGDALLGTWILPWRNNPRFKGQDGKTWEIHRHSEDIVLEGAEEEHMLIGRLLEIHPPIARIVFKHAGYRLEPASRDPWRIHHALFADDGQVVLEITRAESEGSYSKIVLHQAAPILLIAFAYYSVHWLLDHAPFRYVPRPAS
jgi:hypothetical protein